MAKNKNKIICIVQARMGSTRLPGKMMAKIGNKPILQHVIERLALCKHVDEVILATSTNPKDKILVKLAGSMGIKSFAGDEDDVLKRFYDAARKFNADIIVRVPGEEPFIDPGLVDLGIDIHLKSNADYTSTIINRKLIKGLDFEIFTFKTLERINALDKDISSREHVTAYILKNPSIFKMTACDFEKRYWLKDVSLCVDTQEDLEKLRKIYDDLSKKKSFFAAEGIIDYLNS